jgi:hypothetical protein
MISFGQLELEASGKEEIAFDLDIDQPTLNTSPTCTYR